MTLKRPSVRCFHWLYLLILLSVSACGAPPALALPTAYVVRSAATTPATRAPMMSPPPTNPPALAPTLLPTATPALDTPMDQYRAWMREARAAHPYGEPIEVMWDVMLCESSGKTDQVAGSYYGPFQYDQATWAGGWNPYRDSPILDPRAQIFATAKAWQDGNQHWWGCYK